MKTLRNILAVIIATISLILGDIAFRFILVLLTRIPLIGNLFLLGFTDLNEIITYFVLPANCAFSYFVCDLISAKNTVGSGIGKIVFSAILTFFCFLQARLLYQNYGINYTFIIYIAGALIATCLIISEGIKSIKEANQNVSE